MTARRWTLPLFIAVALLHLAPIGSVRYLPTGDGPTHIYNAWVLHGLATGDAPPNIERAYKIDRRPHPNWSGHVLMALAMTVVSPLFAEKLLIALILIVMLGGTWFLATSVDPRNDVYAFLAFPFTWTQSLVAGYYNHSLGIGLFLIILGIWWRRRNRPTIASIALLALLLVLCNFTHPMATLLACGAIVLLSLLTRRFAQIVAIVPVIPLLAMFGTTSESNTGKSLVLSIDWNAAAILARIDTLFAFNHDIKPVAITIAVLYAVLIVFTLVRGKRGEANAIGILALALIAMMFWIPAAAGTRDLFTGRMQPFVFLILPAWFAPLEGRRRIALAALLTIAGVIMGAFAFERIRRFGRELETMIAIFAPIERNTTLLPLFFERPMSASLVPLFPHFISYVALEKQLVDLANYEPATHYFPIADRGPALGSHAIDTNPGGIDLAHPLARADYVVTYGHQRDFAPNRGALHAHYALIHEAGGFRIYRRRPAAITTRELVLLPLVGTRDIVYGTNGAQWKVVQTLHNRASHPLRVIFRHCPENFWCDRDLAPGEIASVETTGRRYAFIDVAHGMSDLLGITTTVRRIDVEQPETSITIPAVPERDFIRGGARIAAIDTRGMKVSVRLYVVGDRAHNDVTLRLRGGDGTVIAQRHFIVENLGVYGNAELRSEISGAELPASLTIEIDVADSVRVWAFVTATDERSGRTSLLSAAAKPPLSTRKH
ncbi:MAG TPA: hypothetical protein VEK79_16990 [Thermoanaerobaculia bacterium]|nr:hypothetical protein [Thermoanaerobaculia bacterium]